MVGGLHSRRWRMKEQLHWDGSFVVNHRLSKGIFWAKYPTPEPFLSPDTKAMQHSNLYLHNIYPRPVEKVMAHSRALGGFHLSFLIGNLSWVD